MAAKKKKPKKKKPAAPPPTRVESFSQNLPVPLKAVEIAERADRAAQLLADRDTKVEEQKAQSKHAKSVIEQIEAEMRRLSGEVRTKRTYQDVDCERVYNYEAATVTERRLDTKEVLSERPMNDVERQQPLPFEPGAEPPKPSGSGDLDDEFGGPPPAGAPEAAKKPEPPKDDEDAEGDEDDSDE